ncbi:glycosyltransferase family 4 protein [archaeon]|jgi:glycosyltransferase involved in cell wall biosynthesis|nr:glycosyltransferase family 4 protein [archaeon]MBT4647216.1 glycosyltransferase family 4 protein [archaeon]
MKILYISRRFYPNIKGGGEVSAFYIAKAAKKKGNKIYVCTFKENEGFFKEVIEDIEIYRFPIKNLQFKSLSSLEFMYLSMLSKTSKIIKKINPDVIHLLNFESIPLASIYYKIIHKKKIVATVNGPNFGCFTGNGLDYKKNICINCILHKRLLCSLNKWGIIKGFIAYIYSIWYINLLKLSYSFIDKFFVVSNAMVPLINNMKVSKKKISVMYNPIEKKEKIKTNLKEKLGIKNKKVILYVGRIVKEKGIQYTLRSMKYLDNCVFIIVGKKERYYNELVKLRKNLKLEDKVIFVGFIDSKNLIKYYSIADCGVLIVDIYESLSRMLVEMYSLNIPLVINDIGGNLEFVDNKKLGILVENKNPKHVSNKIKIALNLNTDNKINNKFSISRFNQKLLKEYNNLF